MADLVDELVNDAVAYIEVGVESGMLTPSKYPRQRAAILMVWALGGLVLHEHLARLVGIDVTEPLDNLAATDAYIMPVWEIYNGFLTDPAYEQLSEALLKASAEAKGTT